MIIADFRCNDCKNIFEVSKKKVLDDFPKDVECPKCKSTDTYRMFGIGNFSIAEGKCGNADNGYSSGIVNHKNTITSGKGKVIKKIK